MTTQAKGNSSDKEQYFWERVDKTPGHGPDGNCWVWTGMRDPNGYGRVSFNSRNIRTHRLSYELTKGQIPKGAHILHSCDNPCCVNPAHLSAGSNDDNIQDKMSRNRHHNQKKTHCKNGHPFSGDNLRVSKRGYRRCKTCATKAQAQRRALIKSN